MMNKIIAVFLVVAIVFSCGAFVVQAHAEIFTVIGSILVNLGFGAVAGLTAGLAKEYISLHPELATDPRYVVVEMINNGTYKNGGIVEIETSGDNVYYKPVDGLTDEYVQEFAEYYCDKLNEANAAETLLNELQIHSGDPLVNASNIAMNSEVYKKIKNDATNAFLGYWNEKVLGNALDVVQPEFDFDFVGPTLPTYSAPARLGSKDLNGFWFENPLLIKNSEGYIDYNDISGGTLFGCPISSVCTEDHDGEIVVRSAYFNYYQNSAYSSDRTMTNYAIFDNDIYFINEYFVPIYNPCDCPQAYFINSNGENLYDKLKGNWFGVYFGLCFNLSPEDGRHTPLQACTADDLMVGGGTVSPDYELTDSEKAVGAATAANIIPQNAVLEIAPDGTIVSVDGISIEALTKLVDNLKNGDYDFSNAEAFYNTCASILRQIKVITDDTTKILNNVKTNIKDITAVKKVMSGIKSLAESQDTHLEHIEEYSAAIAQALDMTKAAELEKENIDINGFIIDHTGLPEATNTVNNIPVINQVKELLNFVLDPDQYLESPPTFKFYWDSNGDGVQETYNALDLSFMEAPLTNENIEDKRRYTSSTSEKPLTVRSFLQTLILFISYVSFGFGIIRKLPGLFGGSESASESFGKMDDYISPTSRYFNMRK